MPSPYELQLTLAPPIILGRRLAPFTLGHAHLLELSNSPFSGTGGKIDSSDMVLAAWILSFPTYKKAKSACLSAIAGKMPFGIRRWGKKIGITFDLEREATKLAEYIGKCTRPPRSARKAGAKSLSTPMAATLAVLHRRYFATTAETVWDVPFLDALLDVITWHHAQGWIDVISDKQADFIDFVKKQAEQK